MCFLHFLGNHLECNGVFEILIIFHLYFMFKKFISKKVLFLSPIVGDEIQRLRKVRNLSRKEEKDNLSVIFKARIIH